VRGATSSPTITSQPTANYRDDQTIAMIRISL
jgi:hypothetical protein